LYVETKQGKIGELRQVMASKSSENKENCTFIFWWI